MSCCCIGLERMFKKVIEKLLVYMDQATENMNRMPDVHQVAREVRSGVAKNKGG